jgi:hypothetical protein
MSIFAYTATEQLTFTCRTPKNFKDHVLGMKTSVEVKGIIERKNNNEYVLSHKTSYKIVAKKGYTWSENSGEEFYIINNPNYKPKKYHDHLQFRFDDYLNSETHSLQTGWGTFHFLFPEFETANEVPKSFRSYLIMSEVDGHFGTTAPLYFWKGKANRDLDSKISAEEELQRSYDVLRNEFGLDEILYNYDKKFLMEQIDNCNNDSACKVTFRRGLEKALISILHDMSDIASPLEIAIHAAEMKYHIDMKYPIPQNSLYLTKQLLRKFLNSNESSISIGENVDDNFLSPEAGESVTDNWVFIIYLPELSDHVYWAIVDKSGKKKTYNYGFN